jgi:hypothetical protein
MTVKRTKTAIVSISLLVLFAEICHAQWTIQNSGTSLTLRSVSFTDSLKGWVVGDSGVILHTDDGGGTWAKQTSGTTVPINSVSFCDSFVGWAVGPSGTKLMTVDGGMNWTRIFHDTAGNIFNTKVKCFDRNNVLVSRIAWYGDYYGGGVLWQWISDSTGSRWQDISPYSGSGLIFTVDDFDFVTKDVGWVIKMDGLNYNWVPQVSRTSNGGSTWTSNQIPSTGYISFSDTTNGFLISNGWVYSYADSTNTFSQIGNIGSYYGGGSICAIGNVVYASSHTAIMKSTDRGTQWIAQSDNGSTISDIEFITPDIGWAVGYNGTILHTNNGGVTSVVRNQAQYAGFDLEQNYPNPFNPSTTIKYELPRASYVNLTVFDVLGRQVSVLVNERKAPGSYEVKFDGSGLASGVYFYRIQAGSYVQSRELLLLR